MLHLEEAVQQFKQRLAANTTSTSQPIDQTKYECFDCLDREFIIKDNSAIPCHCRQQKILQRMIKSSGLTDEQRQVRLAQYKPTKATIGMFLLVKQYLEDFNSIIQSDAVNKGIGLMGSVGVGKTHVLLAVANYLLSQKVPVVFVNTPDLIAELRDAQFAKEHEEGLNTKIERLGEAAVVIFDDVAKEQITDWVQTQYYRIINQRYTRKLPTLFTSNLSFDQISAKIGDATASRLFSMTRDRQMYVEDTDYRIGGGNNV